MYSVVLALHNIIRWVALILAIVAVVRSFLGWFGRREWSARDRKLGAYFGMAMDVQMLLGLLLYFVLSPMMRSALADFGSAMSVSDVRFFAMEHALSMFLAVVFAHMGSVFARKAESSPAKFQRAAIFYALALLLIFMAMPWMRPLFPGLG